MRPESDHDLSHKIKERLEGGDHRLTREDFETSDPCLDFAIKQFEPSTMIATAGLDPDHGISFNGITSPKAFNSQTSAGTLVRAYNTSTTAYLYELQETVADVLLPL